MGGRDDGEATPQPRARQGDRAPTEEREGTWVGTWGPDRTQRQGRLPPTPSSSSCTPAHHVLSIDEATAPHGSRASRALLRSKMNPSERKNL